MIMPPEQDDAVKIASIRGPESGRPDLQGARDGVVFRMAANGDPDAWRELTDRFGGLVHSVARRAGLNEYDASDVAQHTWLRLWESAAQVRDPDRVAGWVATTAHRESIRVSREQARQVPSADPTQYRRCQGSTDPGIDRCQARGTGGQAIQRALSSLPLRYRHLLQLLVSDADLSYAEISAALGIPIGSIGPTRGRSLRILRRSPEFFGRGAWYASDSTAA